MTHWEDLTGELITTGAKMTRTAEFSLHLGRFVHGAAKIVVLGLHASKLIFECTMARSAGRSSRCREVSPLRVLIPDANLCNARQVIFQIASLINLQTCNQCRAP